MSLRLLLIVVCFCVLTLAKEQLLPGYLQRFADAFQSSPFECRECIGMIQMVETLLQENKSEEEITTIAIQVCIDFRIPDYERYKQVCEGIVPEFAPEIIYIVLTKWFNPRELCVEIGACKSLKSVSAPRILLPQTKPKNSPEREHKHMVFKSSQSQLFYHISDVHTDWEYTPGTVIDCGLPLCCRTGTTTNPANVSGTFGSYGLCDTPPTTFVALLDEMASTVSANWVFWTGDITPHDVWNQTFEHQLQRIENVTQLVLQAFPNTQIFPVFGNHDTYPVDQFPSPPMNKELMGNVTNMWAQWLTPESQVTMRYGGYYTQLAEPGLRVLALNTMYCDTNNFWLWLNDSDPAGQLAWVEKVLANASANNEKVYVIGHIAPGSGCYPHYAIRYNAIIHQYMDIVNGHFFGHSHEDEFEIFYGPNFTDPFEMLWIPPAGTTYVGSHSGVNPSFRLFEYDPDTKDIVNYFQYSSDLATANEAGFLTFDLTYSAVEAYSLPDMSAASWSALTERFLTNETLFQEFYLRMTAGGPNSPCTSEACIQSEVCSLRGSINTLPALCMQNLTGSSH